MPEGSGILYVVATPIGNLDDLSPRARGVLGQVDLIAAEDTRHSGKMLRRLGVETPLVSLHEHNEEKRAGEILAQLQAGNSVALISDAGTPLLSDPGYRVVLAVREAGLIASPVPGPCALTAALSVAGLPTDRFVFEGFLPARDKGRQERLRALQSESRTLVFYEAPHRVVKALASMAEVLGSSRPACVARELTKQYESIYYGTLAELHERAANDPMLEKGELVIAVHGNSENAGEDNAVSDADLRQMLDEALKELPPGRAASLVSRLSGRSRKEVYALTGACQKP